MENYKNARELLKKQLYDKLMNDRFGWEINIGDDNYIVDIAFSLEEHKEKIKTVEKIIRHLLFELDRYFFITEDQMAECGEITYQNVPTIFNLLSMNTDIEDPEPIKEEDIYVVDESELYRAPNYKYDIPLSEEDKDVLEKFKACKTLDEKKSFIKDIETRGLEGYNVQEN